MVMVLWPPSLSLSPYLSAGGLLFIRLDTEQHQKAPAVITNYVPQKGQDVFFLALARLRH